MVLGVRGRDPCIYVSARIDSQRCSGGERRGGPHSLTPGRSLNWAAQPGPPTQLQICCSDRSNRKNSILTNLLYPNNNPASRATGRLVCSKVCFVFVTALWPRPRKVDPASSGANSLIGVESRDAAPSATCYLELRCAGNNNISASRCRFSLYRKDMDHRTPSHPNCRIWLFI